MSLLTTIRESLFMNQQAYVRESRTFSYFPPSVKGYVELYYMHVSPLHGLYSTPELQTFMLDLIHLPATEMTPFGITRTDEMEFGCLSYDEVVGYSCEQHWKTLDIVADDVLVPEDFNDTFHRTDTGVITHDLSRRITIFLYPDHGYMYDQEGRLTFNNRARNIRPLSERTPASRKEDELVDSVWIP